MSATKFLSRGALLPRIALPICLGVALGGLLAPEELTDAANSVTATAFQALDWFFLLSVSLFLLLLLWLAIGRAGRLRLGQPDERPEFSTLSWLAMLFAAGMGVGLLFWGVAEPLSHFTAPPAGAPGDAQAARRAMVQTIFHWGLHAWAVYGVAALVLAYFAFRRGAPYLAGAPIRSAFRGRWVEPVAWTADLVAVLAVAFGVAGSVGLGVMQLQTGLHLTTGVPEGSLAVQIVILVALFAAYMSSAATSLDKGIKWLSNINMVIALLVLLFVLLAGPTAVLLRGFVTALGGYLAQLPALALDLSPYRDHGGWLHAWTLTYFIWWIAWAPFVGVFIARISRGRTIREFVFGVLCVPTLFSILWFSVLGGAGIHEELHGHGGIAPLVGQDVTLALFSLFERFPLANLLSTAAIALVFIFLVTSVDSATFVLGMLTSGGSFNPPLRRKLAWGIALGGMGAALMISNSVPVIRAIAVSGAFPFVLVMLLQVVALLRAIAEDEGWGRSDRRKAER